NAVAVYPQYQIDWVRTSQQATETLAKNPPDMVIINVDHFNQQKQTLALQLRQMGYGFPILFLCNSGARLFSKISRRLGHTGIIEKPCSERELVGVIEKLRQGKRVAMRSYRRYETDQLADIEFWNTGRKIDGQMHNLSLGGAQVSVRDSNVRVGDVLKLNVNLEKLSKRHEVNATVVWKGDYDPLTQSSQVGLKFVKTVEIYQSLLSRL
ncbi:MAG TPA: PilZ domain-containing protein, partial [Bdellovibrionales bacterium]|nr:PilZ domain-containing protein [Bdellovibrionales bacterium]